MLKKVRRDWANAEIKRLAGHNTIKPVIMCKSCYSFYYKNSWNLKKPAYLNDYPEEEVSVRLTKCGACLEEENAEYERESSSFMVDSDQVW